MKANRTKTILRRVLALTLAAVCIVPMELITPSAEFVSSADQKKMNDELDFKLITRADKGYNNYSTNAAYWTYQNEYLAAVSDPGQEAIRNATPNSDSWADSVTHNYGWDEGAVTAGNLFWCSMCKESNLHSYVHSSTIFAKWNEDYHERMIQNFGVTYGLIHLTSAKVEKTGSGQITWKNYNYPNNNKATYKYPCVGACMPFVLEVTVPANSSYEVEYAFDLSANSYNGEYAVAVLDGDCNRKCTDMTTYVSGDIISGSESLKYMAMDENPDTFLYVEDDYRQTFQEYKADLERSKQTGEEVTPLEKRPGGIEGGDLADTAYKTFVFNNTSDKAQNFTRAFALIITHQAATDWNVLGDRNANAKLSHYIRGTLDVSVNNIKKSNESLDLRDTTTTESDSADWALVTGNGAGTELSSLQYSAAAGDYLRVGDSVNISKAYAKIDTDFFNQTSERYGRYHRFSCNNYRAYYSPYRPVIKVDMYDRESSATQRTIIVPAKLSMKVNPKETVYARFKMVLETFSMSNGYTVSLMPLGDDVDSTVSSVSPSFSGKETLVYGGKSPGTIGSISSVLSDNTLSGTPETILSTDRTKIENQSDTFYASYVFDNSGSENSRTFERYLLLVITSNRYFTDELKETYPITSYPNLYVQSGTVSLVANLAETRKLDLSTKVGADDTEDSVGGNTIHWSTKDSGEIASILKSLSDRDYHTAVGWERLLMSPTGGGNSTFTGQITDSGTGTVQNDYIHPLGDYLKYAWLDNGAYSYPGAVGSDYLKPEADISTQPLQNCSNFYWEEMASEDGCVTTSDLDAWYIKYAGEVDGEPTYFLAMEGVDGKRYLLVNRFDVVGTGDREAQQMFVTAAEYDAHPELYSTAYGWPTGWEGAKALKSGDESIHTYKGLWQKGVNASGDCNIVADGLTEEAFRIDISNNLQWSIDYVDFEVDYVGEDPCLIYGFHNQTQVDKASLEDSSLYQYYKSIDKKSNNEDIKRFLEYEPEMKNCISKLTGGVVTDYVGIYTTVELDMSTARLSKLYNGAEDHVYSMNAYLGIYEDVSKTADINIGEGETMLVEGSTHIQNGQTLTVGKGGTLQVKGDLTNDGTIICYGTIRIEGGGCIRDVNYQPQGSYNFYGGTLIIGTNGVFYPGYAYASNVVFKGSKIYNDGLFIASAGMNLMSCLIENGTNGVIVTGGGLKKNLNTNGVRSVAEAMLRGNLTAEQIGTLVSDNLVAYGKKYLSLNDITRSKKTTLSNKTGSNNSTEYAQPYFNGYCILHNDGATYFFGGYNVAGQLVEYGTGVDYNIYSISMTQLDGKYLYNKFDSDGFLVGWRTGKWSDSSITNLVNNSKNYCTITGKMKTASSENMVNAFGGNQSEYAAWVAAFDAELNA